MKEEGKVAWRCTNFTCPAQAVTASPISVPGPLWMWEHRLFRGGSAEKLDWRPPRWTFSPLMPDQLANLNLGTPEEPRRYGEKNARKALDALQNARGLPLERWLIAFGIPWWGSCRQGAGGHASRPEACGDSPYLRDIVRLDELVEQAAKTNPTTRENKRR